MTCAVTNQHVKESVLPQETYILLCFGSVPDYPEACVHTADQYQQLLLSMQATKAVKGTLNKLTPEKFERLLQQLVAVVTSAEILHTTISLVFESAVAQPTFVAMYADLCDRLSKVRHHNNVTCRPFSLLVLLFAYFYASTCMLACLFVCVRPHEVSEDCMLTVLP